MSKQTLSVTKDQLVKKLMAIVGPTPATFIARTPVKMNKTMAGDRSKPNPYLDKVVKEQKSNVFINFNYQNSVNRALAKEGKEADFEAKPRKWGVKVPGTPLVTHEGRYYLEARFLNNEPSVKYLMEGQEIEKDLLKPYITEKNVESIKENQGLEEIVIMRDFKIDNIMQITFGGTTYVVSDFE
jgi:hypothetical protein